MSPPYTPRRGWREHWMHGIVMLLVILLIQQILLLVRVPPEYASSHKDTSNAMRDANQVLDFPWYKQPHEQPQHPPSEFSTVNMTLSERRQLQEQSLQRALALSRERFSTIVGIPGTSFTDAQTAQQFRSQVDCWTRGQWIKDTAAFKIKQHLQDPLYSTCDKRFRKTHKDHEQRPEVQYAWKANCPLTSTVDPAKWCQIINGRNVMLVGDLVQYQLHEVLLDVFRDGPAMCYGELNCKDHVLCEEPQANLRYFRNDQLSTAEKFDRNNGRPPVDIVALPFMSRNIVNKYQIYIINRSPVVEDDETFITGLIDMLAMLREHPSEKLIIYRSSSIGHPFCDDATGPLSDYLSESQEYKLPYGWGDTVRRNAIARVIVEAAGGLFVDLGAMTDLRPDGHIGGQDCLRYCIPGPTDAWAQVLYNIFSEI